MESATLMNLEQSPIERLSEVVYARNVPAGKWNSNDGTCQISWFPTDRKIIFSKLRDTCPPLSELKYLEYEKGTRTLILDFSSGRTIRLVREAEPDTPTGVKSTESPTVSENSLPAGLRSGDPINPSHYQNKKGWDIIEFTEDLPFNKGNAIKYIFRAGKKYPELELEDLEKARWYIEREIKRITNA